ncbi:MAG: type II secretion system protein [Verrucomicrobiae bacterium]|nr:type II secretion system protein [Verrucomicrobiae bacterium]
MKHIRKSHRRSTIASLGFTLMELLVVIVLVAALSAIAFYALRRAKLGAVKVADMNNLRSLATAAMAASSDNGGTLPYLHAAGHSSPYYLQGPDWLESNGIYKEMCYIPRKDAEGGPPDYAWWKMFGNQTPVHYCYFAKDDPSGTSWFQRGTVVPPSRAEYRGSVPYDIITKDRTKIFARSFSDDAWYPVLWAGISRDYRDKPHVAAVMKDGKALGVNVMYLDGSGKWVPSEDMKHRYTDSSGTKVYW